MYIFITGIGMEEVWLVLDIFGTSVLFLTNPTITVYITFDLKLDCFPYMFYKKTILFRVLFKNLMTDTSVYCPQGNLTPFILG